DTVNTDGWQATRLAWQTLFPLAVLLRCFLHGWLSIRDGCKKHPLFQGLSERGWAAYRAADRRAFGERVRRAGGGGGAAPERGGRADPERGDPGADAAVVRAGRGVRPGVRAPQRAADQHPAGPGDARDEQLLRRLATPARLARGQPAARRGLGVAAQLQSVEP